MNIWNRLTTHSNLRADMLAFAPDARNTLMSGLRFFTAEFVAGIASLPSPETRQPPIGGRIPRAIYTATGPIIEDVYQKLISRNDGRGQIQAALAQAVLSWWANTTRACVRWVQ